MSEIATALERIWRVADRKGGPARLAEEAGVPYTTVHSLVQRRKHKNLEVIQKLMAAAERIESKDAA